MLGFAQPKYFEKNMGWSNVHEGRRIIQKSIDDYIIMGNVLSPSWKAYTMVIDNNGTTQPQIEYSVSENGNSGGYDIINTEYGYAFCGFLENEFSSSQSYLLQTNHEGGLINTLIIGSNVYANVSFSLCRTTDKGYLLAGFINNSNGLHTPYLIKLDSLGVQQWDKTWDNFTDAFSAFVTAQPAKDGSGYYLVGAINNSYSTGDVLLLKIADDGTEIWQAVYGVNTGAREVPKTLLQTDDGGFAISYMKTTLPESYSGLLKLNADRTIAWNSDSSFYASSPAEKIIHIANEGYLFAGEYETDPVLLNNLDAEIVRLSANGDILWKRHYGGMDNDYIYDFIPTSDGGYFFVGRTESPDLGVPTGGANVYLLKTNCMGLLTEPQANFTAQMDTALLTATFQNLSQYTYPDSIDGGHYLWDFGDGTTSTQINPTHTYAQGGNYSVTLTAVVCSDTSVFVQQVSTWAVGIEASPLPPPKEEEIRVLPNPANEQISISPPSGGWGVQTHTFVLYDVLGKEVASQVLLANGTSVKTQHLPSGIYLYQIINPQNQTLQHGKLSILH